MKITRIQADNIFAIKRLDVRLTTPIALFCGRNGSLKSSIYDTVAMAITRRNARGVTLKKDYGMLVHDGEKAGGALIEIDGDAKRCFAFNMPKGDFTGEAITESMRVSLEGQRFSSIAPDARRVFLAELTNTKPNIELVKARMLEPHYGCDPAKTNEIAPSLRAGFEPACAEAADKAKASKTLWRQLTGETYGSEKAPKWKAPKPDMPTIDAAALGVEVEALDAKIATLNESLGTIKAAQRTATESKKNRVWLEGEAKKLPNLADQLTRAQADLAEYLPKVEALRLRAGGATRVGLVHDMALFMSENIMNGQHERELADVLLMRYEAEHGAIGAKADPAAQASLPEHEKGLTVMQNRVANLQRDVDLAKTSKTQLDALPADIEAVDASADIAEVEGMIAAAKTDRQKTENARLDVLAAIKNRIEADTKTKAALGHHDDVEAWLLVVAALAPDGIPAELLKAAMAPVNTALEQASVDSLWPKVVIKEDMTIMVGRRLYQMESESYKWRADAMIAQVVAELSGLKVLMLDRVDVLDLPARTELFEWLDILVAADALDTALLFAMLKEVPTGMLDTFTAYWVQDGTIMATAKQAAA